MDSQVTSIFHIVVLCALLGRYPFLIMACLMIWRSEGMRVLLEDFEVSHDDRVPANGAVALAI